MPDMVKVKINGTEYEFEKGLTVLQAAEQVGIKIPHFCWHKHLSISGNCRMCLVDIKPGPPKPQIACAMPIADGMEVTTESEAIEKRRKAVLQFLLLNHPLDCPVCDEAYECKLQDYTYEYGPQISKFVKNHHDKRIYKRIDLGKMFVEMNRCIECTRCVRFLRELGGQHEFERLYRGHKLKIFTHKHKIESDFALNAADLCPVGALEDKKFRFSVRNWDIRRTPTICPSCSIGCNIDLDHFENKIKRLMPRENDVVNACWMCDAGRHNFDFVNENRIGQPHLRKDADLVPTDYTSALEEVRKGLESVKAVHGGDAIGILLSPWMTNEELFLGKKLGALLGAGKVGMLAGYNKRPVVPVMSGPLPKTLVSDDKTPNSTGGRLLGLKEGDAEFTFAHELCTSIEDGKIKALVLFHEDLADRDGFDLAAVRKAMALLDTLIVVAWKPTQIATQANVMLPSLTFAEKNGTFTNHSKRVQRIRKGPQSYPDVKSELEIITEIGRLFDHEFGCDEPKQAFAAMAAEEPVFSGLDWAAIGEMGVAIKSTDG